MRILITEGPGSIELTGNSSQIGFGTPTDARTRDDPRCVAPMSKARRVLGLA